MYKGYFFTLGNKGYFLITDRRVRNDNLARDIIDLIAENNPKKYLDLVTFKQDRNTLDYIKLNSVLATLDKVITKNGYEYMTIYGEHFTSNYPMEDFFKEIIVGWNCFAWNMAWLMSCYGHARQLRRKEENNDNN